MKTALFVFFLFSSFLLYGKDIKIGVYRENNIQEADFAYYKGEYKIYGDTNFLGVLTSLEFISIKRENQKVILAKGVNILGSFNKVYLKAKGTENALRIRPQRPVLREKKYQDDFIVFSSSKGLTIVNDVSFPHYLEGVIESEGGGGKHLEYYKSQAVISRTYALRHFNRHKDEGFNLCNLVHCQAYHNMLSYADEIKKAVIETDGVYMVDTTSNQLVEAYFHANCGGETSSSDYVWREDISYLQPFKDTFCIYTKQAKWEKRIPKAEWKNFLVNNYFYPIYDSVYNSMIYTFTQESRKAFYISPVLGIPLRDIRYQFNLKSTFFSCYPDGDDVVLEGRGYGHGVGLCQEGAMNMAKKGLDYQQILKYYYSGVIFLDKYQKIFFKQEVEPKIDF